LEFSINIENVFIKIILLIEPLTPKLNSNFSHLKKPKIILKK